MAKNRKQPILDASARRYIINGEHLVEMIGPEHAVCTTASMTLKTHEALFFMYEHDVVTMTLPGLDIRRVI